MALRIIISVQTSNKSQDAKYAFLPALAKTPPSEVITDYGRRVESEYNDAKLASLSISNYIQDNTPFQLVCWEVNPFRPLPSLSDEYLILFLQEVFLNEHM